MNKRNLFYYDESFHTRVITKGYIDDENDCDSYVGVSVGWNVSKDNSIRNEYEVFEKQYKEFYSVNELKSDIIGKKFYSYGFASFRKEHIKLYNEYFDICIKNNMYVYITVLSKMENIIRQIIGPKYGYNTELGQGLIYTITKMILLYRPESVISKLLSGEEEFFVELRRFIKLKIREIKNLEHKQKEEDVFRVCLVCLQQENLGDIEFDWNYNIAFWGLKLLIEEINLNINRLELTIDNEGEENIDSKTLCSAKICGFPQAIEVKSENEIGVRVADMMCGFIGRFIRALEKAHLYEEDDYKKIKYLDNKWFHLNSEQFMLYKKVAKYYFIQVNHYYLTYSGIYADELCMLIGLLRYIDTYESYENFKEVSAEHHVKNVNSYICSYIGRGFERLGTTDSYQYNKHKLS